MFIGYLKTGFEDCLENLINKNSLFDLKNKQNAVN